jgi:hypothetical protein
MLPQTRPRAAIHPSIDGLVTLIQKAGKQSAQETEQLREMCRSKIRSYREDVYLKRYNTPTEQQAARQRWQLVADFANRSK